MSLKIGDIAPEFTLYDTERKERSLKEFVGQKTLLAFYPGAFTGACSKEMCTFRDSLSMLESLKAKIVGISVDSPFANKAFAEQNTLTFPLLSDYNRSVSMKYCGVYPDFGGLSGYKAAKRSVFLLDSVGKVKYVWVTEAPGTEPDYEEVKKALSSW
jgi:glutaredoxin-dependent peroxiredoxin